MITVHHLNESRSQRILWLLEELDLPYEIRHYTRDPQTRLAPPELEAVHPLGKSPVITDGGKILHESGAICEYLVWAAGGNRLQPSIDAPDYYQYVEWLHYAEGSAMLPLMLLMYVMRLGEAGAPLHPRIESEIARHLGFIDASLNGREWLMGAEFTAADVQLSFVGEVAQAFGKRAAYPNLDAWTKRCHARPAWARALAKGGPYALGQ